MMKKKTVSRTILVLLLIDMLTLVFNVALTPAQIKEDFAATIHEAKTDTWPMFRHDNMRTGYSKCDAPDTNRTLWKKQVDYWLGHSSVIVADDKVFVNCERLLGLPEFTGRGVWTFGDQEDYFWDAAYANGKVFVGGITGRLYCLDARVGSLVWNRTVNSPIVSSPVIVDGKVLFGTLDGNLFVLDEKNGGLLWNKRLGYESALSPAVAYGKIFGVAFDFDDGPIGIVSALDQDTGEILWNYSFPYTRYGLGTYQNVPLISPAVGDNRAYIGALSGLYCLDVDSGNLIWSHNMSEIVVTTSTTLGYGRVFVGAANGSDLYESNIYAFDAATGKLIWTYPTGWTWPVSAPAVADHKVFVGTGEGEFCALSESNGNKVWSYKMGECIGSPAVADGKIFVCSSENGDRKGYVYAFEHTVVYVDPVVSYTPVGQTFSVDVCIANVSYLWGYEFRLFYDTTILDSRSVDLPEGHFLTPSKLDYIFVLDKTNDTFNATHGMIWFSAVLLDVHTERPKNGSGVLATVTFEAKAEGGPSPLSLWCPNFDYPVKLATSPGLNPPWTGPFPIPCTAGDGYFGNISPGVFSVAWEGVIYHVTTVSDSTITGFSFNQPSKQISFSVTGPSGTVGFCNVTIPNTLLWGNFVVLVDGEPPIFLIRKHNTTHTSLYFTYELQSTRNVRVIGTEVRAHTSPDLNDDGIVDIYDLIIWANAFPSQPGWPNWNPDVDLNQDGIIDIFDLVIVAVNYAKKYP